MTLQHEPFEIVAEGWLARIFQHEYDHLDGVLYVDRLEHRTPKAGGKGGPQERVGHAGTDAGCRESTTSTAQPGTQPADTRQLTAPPSQVMARMTAAVTAAAATTTMNGARRRAVPAATTSAGTLASIDDPSPDAEGLGSTTGREQRDGEQVGDPRRASASPARAAGTR